MWIQYNPNPVQTGAGDCAVRAIAKALDLTWERAYARLVSNGFLMGDMPSSDLVWGSVLRQEGFRREMIPNTCPDCFTAADFCREHPEPGGVYVLKSNGHVCTAVSGDIYDSWNSENNVVIYYWHKPEEG